MNGRVYSSENGHMFLEMICVCALGILGARSDLLDHGIVLQILFWDSLEQGALLKMLGHPDSELFHVRYGVGDPADGE